MTRFHIELRDEALSQRGWDGLTPDEERAFLHDLLAAIRSANLSGDPHPIEAAIETWWRHGILAEAGTPEEGRERAQEALDLHGPRTIDTIVEALDQAVARQSATTTR